MSIIRELTCVVCPNGCSLTLTPGPDGGDPVVGGALCPRGEAYARQEMACPMRTMASSVRVCGGDMPLVSVRLNRPVPLAAVPRVMEAIRDLSVQAPVAIGDVLLADVTGSGSDVIATRHVKKRSGAGAADR